MNTKKLVEAIREELGPEYEVKEIEVEKNNGKKLTGITAHKSDSNISPVFYPSSDDDPSEWIEKFCDYVRNGRHDIAFTKEDILQNASFKVLNKDLNEEKMKNVLHMDFLDLAAIPIARLESLSGRGIVEISQSLLDSFDLTIEEIQESAVKNISQELKISPMSEILGIGFGSPEMYVITNTEGFLGASALLICDGFRKVADELGEDLLIIPSSIHELIAVRASSVTVGQLREMIEETNHTSVSPGEILSNNPYIFDRKRNELRLAQA